METGINLLVILAIFTIVMYGESPVEAEQKIPVDSTMVLEGVRKIWPNCRLISPLLGSHPCLHLRNPGSCNVYSVTHRGNISHFDNSTAVLLPATCSLSCESVLFLNKT